MTLGTGTFKLDDPFLALGTQSPIEHEDIRPLPEAQVHRFMMRLVVGYSSKDEEGMILDYLRVP